jgi:hypothetical protein
MNSQPSTQVARSGKGDHPAPVLSQFEQRMRVLELTVQLLIVRTSMGDYWADGLRDAAELVAALPLLTIEYASISRHLRNALDYCEQLEFGAATFELRAMRGQLLRI